MILTQTYDVDEILKTGMPEMEVLEFNPFQLKNGEKEESLVIYRTKRNTTTDPYVFYIQSIAKRYPKGQDMQKFLEVETKARHISEEEFMQSTKELLSKLKQKYPFILKGTFVDAIAIEEEGLTKSLLCETTEELIFFNWDTKMHYE